MKYYIIEFDVMDGGNGYYQKIVRECSNIEEAEKEAIEYAKEWYEDEDVMVEDKIVEFPYEGVKLQVDSIFEIPLEDYLVLRKYL